jgi:serine/threonine protein kinase
MACLDENAVLELFDSSAGEARRRVLQGHIDECPACRLLVAAVARVSLAAQPGGGDDATMPASHAPIVSVRSSLPQLAEGDLIDGRYRLDAFVGEGGLGIVWAATHIVLRRPVALKFLKHLGAEQSGRFLREARISATLRHPHIVEVYDVLQLPEGAGMAMVMELLTGESLKARLARDPVLSPSEVASILLPVVSAVSAAHAASIVHRDLKPDNVFLVRGPIGVHTVKVLDFGLAKLLDVETRLTQSGAVLGTPHYMAPEQVTADKSIDHRADVWALGVILFEMLAGVRPVRGSGFGSIFQAVTTGELPRLGDRAPAELDALASRMLTRDRSLRPALAEVYETLARFAVPV